MSRMIQKRAQIVRLLVPAGKATPSPPIGPALGAKGVKSMDFCKEFNARTSHIEPGTPVPTLITIEPDRTFSFSTKTPPTAYFLKKAAGIEKGTGRPGHDWAGSVSLKHVYEIAKIKATDDHMKHLKLESIASSVVGVARTLGLRLYPTTFEQLSMAALALMDRLPHAGFMILERSKSNFVRRYPSGAGQQ